MWKSHPVHIHPSAERTHVVPRAGLTREKMGHDFPEGKLALVHSVYAAVAVLFNVVAASHALTWRKFTVNNPILGSVAVVIVYAITIAVLVGGGHDALGLYG